MYYPLSIPPFRGMNFVLKNYTQLHIQQTYFCLKLSGKVHKNIAKQQSPNKIIFKKIKAHILVYSDSVTQSMNHYSPNSTWVVTSRLTRSTCRQSLDECVEPCCSNIADDEQAIVLACTSLVVFMFLHTQILFVPSNNKIK